MPVAQRDYEDKTAETSTYDASWPATRTVVNEHSPRQDSRLDDLHEITSDGWSSGGFSRADIWAESRAEIIERIKKRSPTWKQTSLSDRIETVPDTLKTPEPLLPAAEIAVRPRSPIINRELVDLEDPSGIERPRSALHSGDFRQESPPHRRVENLPGYKSPSCLPNREWISTSPTTPWYIPALYQPQSPNDIELRPPVFRPSDPIAVQARSRPVSQSSLSSSFAFRPPTSPLAQQENSADFEIRMPRVRSGSPEKYSRRHTFTQQSLQVLRRSSEQAVPLVSETPLLGIRREGTYQAHQPRRSTNSLQSSFSYSTPQSPFLQSRRPSISSDISPIQRAPLVGPYEESILRGRMSTLPSRPLDFVAQIGVLGIGHCKPNLRCPPHLIVPFPAVFYSYSDAKPRHSVVGDGPSPYVGLIDLETSAKADDPSELYFSDNKQPHSSETFENLGRDSDEDEGNISPLGQRRRKRKDKGATSKKAPRGSYRIPQQGQLQIVIKNPNKTAVKLFLVPYDLSGMEAGQKTFLRQRSYSAGPIIDMPISSRTNFGTAIPEAALSTSDNPADRPVLRYLIHLNICSPSAGRFYLYKSIRVVFANRVPDSKEKLRNEIQLPEPRYSAYRPDHRLSRGPSDW